MKQLVLLFALLLGVTTACNNNANESATPSASTDDVEVVYDEPETIADVESLDVTQPSAREASATSTVQYFQCKTDDGDLLTPTFTIVDYYYGDTPPPQSVLANWNAENAKGAKHGAKTVTITTPRGTQLVKSKSMKHGWHIVSSGESTQEADWPISTPFQVLPDVKGLIELSWVSSVRFIADHALVRINYKYVVKSGDRYDSYTANQQQGKTFAQWAGTTTMENVDWDAVTSTYQVQPVAGATTGTFKSVAYRVPRFKGYVFTEDASNRPRGADVDLIGKKGVSLTYRKIQTSN